MADKETGLMLRVKAGDRAAFEEIFQLYQKPLANYLFRLTGNRARTEDLIQDTFLRLWKAAPTYEPTAKVSTYVFRIAHNLFLNETARRREKALESMDAETRSDPASDLNRREIRSALAPRPTAEHDRHSRYPHGSARFLPDANVLDRGTASQSVRCRPVR